MRSPEGAACPPKLEERRQKATSGGFSQNETAIPHFAPAPCGLLAAQAQAFLALEEAAEFPRQLEGQTLGLTMSSIKRTIEVDDETAAALESRAAEAGLSISELLTEIARQSAPAEISAAELTELDGQWAAIEAGEPTVSHEQIARWLDAWGTPSFRPRDDR